MFTKRQYVDYLIATNGNYTCTNLADHLEGEAAVSHDAVTDFLGRARLTPRQLWAVVAPRLQDGPDSYLLVDDSIQNKEHSTKIDFVKLQYSGAEHGLVRGIGVVNLVHTNGQEHGFYPIDYRIYHKPGDGKTKHDHFLEMLYRAISDKGIQARTILFDNWYASTRVLKIIHRLDRYFITTLKSNRKVSLSAEAGYVSLDDLPWDTDALRHGLLIKLKALPFKVRLFKLVAANGDIDWVITNRPDDPQRPITADAIRDENAIRWQVEQFHRDVKQLTGTERCQCRKARAQRNHLACCYLAWLSLAIHARDAGVTLYAAHKGLWDNYLKSILRAPPIRAVGCV